VAVAAILCAAGLFGTTGTVLVNRPEGADPWSVGVVRLLVGGLTLTALSCSGRRWSQPWRVGPVLAVVGAVGAAVFQTGYFLAVERTGVAVGTVVTIGSGPAVSGMIAAVRDRRRPPASWIVGTSIAVAGVVVMGLVGRSDEADALGLALAVAAGTGWATFSASGAALIRRGADSTATMASTFLGGAILLAPLLLTHSGGWVSEPNGLLVAGYLGVVTVGVAYTLYGIALRHLAAPTVITLTLLEPITATVLGVLVVHEALTLAGVLGGVMVLVGLTTTARGALRR